MGRSMEHRKGVRASFLRPAPTIPSDNLPPAGLIHEEMMISHEPANTREPAGLWKTSRSSVTTRPCSAAGSRRASRACRFELGYVSP